MTSRLDEHLAGFKHGVLIDAWLAGTAMFWERRAQQLEAARPRRGDWVPSGKPASEVAAAWDRLTEAAAACRARASLADATLRELDETLRDIATARDLELLDAEQQLRAAIDADDRDAIAHLEHIIDDLDQRTGTRRKVPAA